MRKRNSISFETRREFFDAESFAEKGGSRFVVHGGSEPVAFEVPTSIMHRLFRLGQAYGLRQLRYLESDTSILIGQVEIQEFIADLRKLRVLVNDEPVHEQIDRLLVVLTAPTQKGLRSVAVKCGSYFERRT